MNRHPDRHTPEHRDEGNLVMVLVLLIALATAALTTVATVVPGFLVAHSSQAGEQAVAQANAGLSDALFRLDQSRDTVVDFCVGNAPAALLPSDLTNAQCLAHSSPAPLPGSPGLQYYIVTRVPVTLQQGSGVTDQLAIVSHASVGGQQRTVKALIYRVADTFAFFADSGFTDDGALKNASVLEVSGFGAGSAPLVNGTVNVGVGPNGGAVCNGQSGTGTQIVTVGQNGSTLVACPQPQQETTSFVAQEPTVCAAGQHSVAFSPCIDTTTFASSAGSTYCPMPGIGIPNSLATSLTLTPPPNAVFDCRTSGSAVTIGTNPAGGGVPFPIPFNLGTIPPGTYYFDSNNVTLADIDPSKLVGPVNIFILPAQCAGNSCPLSLPTQAGSGCTQAVPASPALTLGDSAYMNATRTPQPPFTWGTPGDVANLSVFWSGNGNVNPGKNAVFDGFLYSPAATMASNGATSPTLFGMFNLDCFTQHGGPQMYLVYPQHANQYLQGWTVTSYRITP